MAGRPEETHNALAVQFDVDGVSPDSAARAVAAHLDTLGLKASFSSGDEYDRVALVRVPPPADLGSLKEAVESFLASLGGVSFTSVFTTYLPDAYAPPRRQSPPGPRQRPSGLAERSTGGSLGRPR